MYDKSRRNRSNTITIFLLTLIFSSVTYAFVIDGYSDTNRSRTKPRKRVVTAAVKDCLKSHLSPDFQKTHANIKGSVHEGDGIGHIMQNVGTYLKSISLRDYNQVYASYQECVD